MINRKSFYSLFLAIFFIFHGDGTSQFESHPEVDWFTIETKHFTVSYHEGTERTAQITAQIAEEIFDPITSLYNYKPDEKIHFIINDLSDIANGATDYIGNRIEIFSSALDFELRGTHNWLRNVITHEFTHVIQIQSALKFSKKVPAIYLQLINYEKERRQDVLYGYPNTIISYPISSIGVPAWLAEGTAQYQRQQLGYDYWDAHRDMIMRSYILDDNMLTWNEMGQFSSITSLKAESIYNSGFALTRYIAYKYGESKLKEISKKLGDFSVFSVDKAIKETIGKDGKDLYEEWIKYLKEDYSKRLTDVNKTIVEGEIIEKKGFANYMPHFSPDGKKIAYLSNQEYDFATTGLVIYDLKTKEKKLIDAPVSSNFSWSPDGNEIIYAKRNSPPSLDNTVKFDLYTYNIKSKSINRLTEEERTFSPSYSNDGKKICYIINKDGTLNLVLSDKDVRNKKLLTNYKNGEQIYNPIFSNDDEKIYFEYSLKDSRKIASIDLRTLTIEFLFDNDNIDNRNPVLSSDGKKIYFSSNKTGIFNIYSYNFETNETKQITNVTGGAFMPTIDNKGNMAYATYKSTGYKIALLKGFTESDTSLLGSYEKPDKLVKKYSDHDSEQKEKSNWEQLRNFDDSNITPKKVTPYKSIFTQLSIFPVLRFDNYSKSNNFLDAIKPGIYVYSDEIMNRFSIFGGFTVNRRMERDIFIQFNYDNGLPIEGKFFAKKLNFSPKFSFTGYNVTRKTDAQLYAGIDTLSVGVNYDLISLELSMDFKLFNFNHDFKFLYTLSKYNSSIDGFYIPSSGLSVRGSSQDYFRAHDFSLEYKYEHTKGSRDMDINPVGRKVFIKYDYEISKINPELIVDDQGNVSTEFQTNNLHKIDASWLESISLFKKHSLNFKLRTAAILGKPVDDFYDFYASGLVGMRGYPYFSMGGGRLLTANVTYRFPLLTKIDTRISPLYLDKLYLSIFGDFGDAWEGSDYKLNNFKKDIGAELRLQAFSYYVFPTSIFFSAAYGFDEFSNIYNGKLVNYGKEWQFYFGVLFGFDF